MQAGHTHLFDLVVDEFSIATEERTPLDIVKAVEAEIPVQYKPLRFQAVVRTDPMVQKSTGGLLLTGKETGFYSGMGHAKIIKATVLAVGQNSCLQVGDRVCFQRLYFCRLDELKDGTYIGCIDENELVGYIVEE